MRSHRLPRDLTSNALTRALDAARARGVEVLDLTVSNPTRAGIEYPADLLRGLADPRALFYEPHPLGLDAARSAVAAEFARRGCHVPPERVALTASTSEAYAWLFKLLCDPGDAVLVPRPSYPLFDHLTRLESVEARPYRLEYHGVWRLDIEHVRSSVDARTRAVLVVSPNNPTGSFLHPDDLSALASLCAAHRMVLVVDEVFADYVLDAPAPPAPVFEAGDAVVCSLGGLSKSIGLPQIKVGWIGFGGPEPQVHELMEAYELVADTYLSVSTPAQLAVPDLLARGAEVRRHIQHRLARNLHALRLAAATVPEVSVLGVEGGWSAVMQVPAITSEEALVLELLTDEHVLVHPGFFFDFEREAFLVLSLLTPPSELERGLSRVLARVSARGAAS